MGDNLLHPNEFRKIAAAASDSRTRLGNFRRNRLDLLKQVVGPRYGALDDGKRIYVNMTKTALGIWRRKLVAKEPKALVAPRLRSLRFSADMFSLALDQDLKDMAFGTSLATWVTEALLLGGFMQVGVAEAGRVSLDGESVGVGQIYAEPIDFDDWVHDANSRSWKHCRYLGHRYRMPIAEARENPYFDKETRHKLTALERPQMNEGGDQRASGMSGDDSWRDEDWREEVELWDLTIPGQGVVVTYAAESSSDGGGSANTQLCVRDYRGPGRHSYHKLFYGSVPGNIMPSPPAETIFEIDLLNNQVFRKLARGAVDQKTILGYMGQAKDDADRVVNANDGEAIMMDNPEGAREFRFGGPDQKNFAFFLQLRQIISYLGGNLDTVGGLASNADTATQEKLMSESASEMISEMQDITHVAVRDVVRDIAWHRWNDPIKNTPVRREIAGIDQTFSWPFAADDNPGMPADLRQGSFESYQVDIEPYSMVGRTPAERLNLIQSAIERLYLPLQPMAQEQGIGIDLHELFRLVADYSGTPELSGILTYQEPQAIQQQASSDRPRQAPVTRRENVRINRAGASQQGAESALIQKLMGGNPQEAEMAAVGRVGG